MKGVIGLVLVLVGGAIALVGIGIALHAIIGLYAGAMSDPLNQPEGTEVAVKDQMIRGAIIGLAGGPFLVAGGLMLKISMIQKIRRMAERRAAEPGARK